MICIYRKEYNRVTERESNEQKGSSRAASVSFSLCVCVCVYN
jgi:hypothetical protein